MKTNNKFEYIISDTLAVCFQLTSILNLSLMVLNRPFLARIKGSFVIFLNLLLVTIELENS